MDVMDWGRAVAALAATLALLGLLAVLARRFNMIQPLRGPGDRRMTVIETLMLDPRRKLVIVRAGETEHLLLLSPFGDSRLDSATRFAPLAPPAPTLAPAADEPGAERAP
jgi:flagellar protein FliO/FliZ